MLNLAEIKNAHRMLLAEHDKAVGAELERGGQFAADHVKKNHRFKSRSGRLKNSTRHRVIRRSGGGRLVLRWPRVPYAAAIDSGARPHRIVARRRRFLKFRGPSGAVVFRRSVNHPGNRPFRFGWRALHATHRRFGTRMQQRMQAIAARF
jgi:hypothetical protein